MNRRNLDEWKDALSQHLLLFLHWGSGQHGSCQGFLERGHCLESQESACGAQHIDNGHLFATNLSWHNHAALLCRGLHDAR